MCLENVILIEGNETAKQWRESYECSQDKNISQIAYTAFNLYILLSRL